LTVPEVVVFEDDLAVGQSQKPGACLSCSPTFSHLA